MARRVIEGSDFRNAAQSSANPPKSDAPPSGGAVQCPTRPASRSVWIDNLRTLVIVLVVNIHACVTCSHVDGWHLKEG